MSENLIPGAKMHSVFQRHMQIEKADLIEEEAENPNNRESCICLNAFVVVVVLFQGLIGVAVKKKSQNKINVKGFSIY